MNRMYIWCVLLLLVGCQQPTVYVYTENLDAQQQAQLDLALSAQRLPYKYTQLSVPREFGDATLMLSEDKILTEQTEILAGIMQRLGYQPENQIHHRRKSLLQSWQYWLLLKSTE